MTRKCGGIFGENVNFVGIMFQYTTHCVAHRAIHVQLLRSWGLILDFL